METDLLEMGLNFWITSKTLTNKDIIATIEHAIKDLEKEEADMIYANVSLTLQNSKLLRITCPRMSTKLWKSYNLKRQL